VIPVVSRSVSDIMTKDVVTVPPDASFKAVVCALEGRRVDAAPVVDAAGRVVGVVSEADLTCHDEQEASLAALLLGGRDRRTHARKARGRTARELMTSPALAVEPDATVCQALEQMQRSGIGRVLVIDDGRLVGIVTRSDVLRVYTRPDDEIAAEIEQAARRSVGECPARLDVEVRDGIAILRGWVERTSCAWALAGVARGVPGVVDVDDDILSDIDDTEVNELALRGPFL
jgi:CBS domain-containing protein